MTNWMIKTNVKLTQTTCTAQTQTFTHIAEKYWAMLSTCCL